MVHICHLSSVCIQSTCNETSSQFHVPSHQFFSVRLGFLPFLVVGTHHLPVAVVFAAFPLSSLSMRGRGSLQIENVFTFRRLVFSKVRKQALAR